MQEMEVDLQHDGSETNVPVTSDLNGVQNMSTEQPADTAAGEQPESTSQELDNKENVETSRSEPDETGVSEEGRVSNAAASTEPTESLDENDQTMTLVEDEPAGAEKPAEEKPISGEKRIPQSPLDGEAPSKKSKENTPPLALDPQASIAAQPTNAKSTIVPDTTDQSSTAPITSDEISASYDNMEHAIAEVIRDKLEEIPDVVPLKPLTLRDLAELENALQLGDQYDFSPDDGWKKDWGGNLQLFEKEVVVNRGYVTSHPKNIKPIQIPFHEWVAKNSTESNCLRGLELLFAYVYHMKDTPDMARKILAHAMERPASSLEKRLEFMLDAIKRTTYDPIVLQQDRWITKKSESPEGSMGGSNIIGKRIIWQRFEAVIIAFTRDDTWGALWKAIWVEDLDTFDLETDEVHEALSKYEKKQARINKKKIASANVVTGGTRNAATARFLVKGIEHGIILALPSKGSRGVMWPARVVHVSEMNSYSGGRRNSATTKFQIQVVFLAPFWNGNASASSKEGTNPYSLGPYFEIDTIDVTENTIKKYPFESVSIEDFQNAFQFLGLPKGMLSRYIDSHRLALALKTYARKHIPTNYLPGDENVFASASLTDSHVLSVLAPIFPHEVLDLPYDFILNNLPRAHTTSFDTDETTTEQCINIKSIIDSMTPPLCFGRKQLSEGTNLTLSPENSQSCQMIMSPKPNFSPNKNGSVNAEDDDVIWSVKNFASELLTDLFEQASANQCIVNVVQLLNSLISQLKELSDEFSGLDVKKQRKELKRILCQCLLVKGYGEDLLACSTLPSGLKVATVVIEWRKACERVYKRAVSKLNIIGAGNGYTTVVTDSRCNGHITADGAYERPVRLPAAIKGARLAGAGVDPCVPLVNTIEDSYLEIAEEKVIPKAHQRSYVKRLKTKIAAIPANETGVSLTDDSEGEGGDDTKGSRGSYTAATVGIAAAIKAVDMVVGGQCVNVFCAIRPPGHHAGRELRPMKAVSNGFCLFNAAACAAIYAATSKADGGLGLRRVCVIDFDVHHGNGTQDILCNTHDPRFLYVSMHAGGSHINGFEDEDSEDEAFRLNPGSKTTEGIFPGRCGDTNPHEGVLNIPLGRKVTPIDLGTALVSKVFPKVEQFSPDLIILSAGFDAHKNDPLGMGGLSSHDFGHVTEVACQLAFKTCSGRILSVLEGGYGVPCCRARTDLFLPQKEALQEKLLELGQDLPDSMDDPVPVLLRQRLDKCHAEGFLDCVKEHVKSFVKFNKRK